MDKYDLEILTNDWSRYDANSAIVRTSKLSPEEMTRFVTDFEGEINEAWDKQVKGFWDKTNPPELNFRVEGYLRTQFVYKLFSEDLIERYGLLNGLYTPEESICVLCDRLVKATGGHEEMIKNAIRRFLELGYIKQKKEGAGYRWYWTHNNRVDECPLCT